MKNSGRCVIPQIRTRTYHQPYRKTTEAIARITLEDGSATSTVPQLDRHPVVTKVQLRKGFTFSNHTYEQRRFHLGADTKP